MTVRKSTGYRISALGNVAIKGTNYSFVDGGTGEDTLVSAINDFTDKGFRVGDTVTIAGSTSNDGDHVITGVAAGALNFITGSWTLAESFLAGTTGIADNGGSFQDIFNYSVLRIYSGNQPNGGADAAETGDLLVEISNASGTFVPVTGTNGLQFQMISTNSARTLTTMSLKDGMVASGVAVATGVAGYARLYDIRRDTGLSYIARRIDLDVATSGSQVTIPSLNIYAGATTTVDSINVSVAY